MEKTSLVKHPRTYDEVDALLAECTDRSSGAYTLERMKRFMSFLGNPQDALSVIHVAGTSGKTSTAYYIDAILREHGQEVGLSVSPHIDVVGERAQVNGRPIPEDEYCKLFSKFLILVRESKETMSYFELLVAFAYWVFVQKNVKYAVVEVGLGGLLDATNVVSNSSKISVISTIGMDHVEVLGDSLEKIAKQKAGIILPNSTVFLQDQPEEVLDAVWEVAESENARIHVVKPLVDKSSNIAIGLPPFQHKNFNLARQVCGFVLQHRNITLDENLLRAAAGVYIPGRMEVVSYQKDIVLDGSHNPQKMAALVNGMRSHYGDVKVVSLVGFGKNKQRDIHETLSELHVISDDIILTRFLRTQDQIREAIDPNELKRICRKVGFKNMTVVADPAQAFYTLISRNEDKVLVTGSYYLLNHIRPLIFNGYKNRDPAYQGPSPRLPQQK